MVPQTFMHCHHLVFGRQQRNLLPVFAFCCHMANRFHSICGTDVGCQLPNRRCRDAFYGAYLPGSIQFRGVCLLGATRDQQLAKQAFQTAMLGSYLRRVLAGRSGPTAVRRASLEWQGMVSEVQEPEVIVEEGPASRTAILNRPRKLNALNGTMALRLRELYESWEKDPGVRVVILKGNGRAFCAGGDVGACYNWGVQGEHEKGVQFFRDEYLLNYLIGTLKKPHVALLQGIVMGGGNGLSMHGRFRVATEKTVFAMPEAVLGLHPDVGASHFLSRLPGRCGEYLGLTGDRLDGADLLHCGLATHFVPTQRLPRLEERLSSLQSSDPEVVSTVIDEFCDAAQIGDKSPWQKHRRAAIDRCFSRGTVEEILEALEAEAMVNSQDGWYHSTITNLKKASPTSLKVTLRSVRQGRNQPLYQCLAHEFRLSVRFMRAEVSTDFYEGCRAILVDKDNSPKWKPDALSEVPDVHVNAFFVPLESELELPVQDRESQPTTQRHRSKL